MITLEVNETQKIKELEEIIEKHKKNILDLGQEITKIKKEITDLEKVEINIKSRPPIEYKSQKHDEKAGWFCADEWCYEFRSPDNIPINEVELSCTVNGKKELLIINNAVEKIDSALHGVAYDHRSKLSSRHKNQNGSEVNIYEVINDNYDATGEFTIKNEDLANGYLKITFRSKGINDCSAAVRLFVLPENIPFYRKEIDEANNSKKQREDWLKIKAEKLREAQSLCAADEDYLNLIRFNMRPEPDESVERIKGLLYLLDWGRDKFMTKFFPEIDQSVQGWIQNLDNFELLKRLMNCTAGQFKEILDEDIDSRKYSTLLMGPDPKSSGSVILESELKLLGDEVKKYFKLLMLVSNKTKLPIRSIRDLLLWQFKSDVNEPLPRQVLRLNVYKRERGFVFEALKRNYKKQVLKINALIKIDSIFKFSKDFLQNYIVRDCLSLLSEKWLVDALKNDYSSFFEKEQQRELKIGCLKNQSQYSNYGLFALDKYFNENDSYLSPSKTVSREGYERDDSDTTLRDGNCAINAVVLGVLDLIEKNVLQDFKVVEDFCKPANVNGLLDWLSKNKNSIQRQKQFAPLFRKMAIEFIESQYEHYRASYIEGLIAAFNNFRSSHLLDETFLVHCFIKTKFEILKSQLIKRSESESNKDNKDTKEMSEHQITSFVQEDLTEWWNHEGKEQYFKAMKEEAYSSGDLGRWGSEIEINALALRFKITILNGQQILGLGYGLLENINEEDAKQLEALGIGNRQFGIFCLKIKDKIELEKILHESRLSEVEQKCLDETGRQQVLNYINNNDKMAKIPNIQNIEAFVSKLKKLKFLVDSKGKKSVRFVSIETLQQLMKSISTELKKKILAAHLPNIPAFKVRHEGAHWFFVKVNENSREILTGFKQTLSAIKANEELPSSTLDRTERPKKGSSQPDDWVQVNVEMGSISNASNNLSVSQSSIASNGTEKQTALQFARSSKK